MKLNFNTDYLEAIKQISEGNPGALRVLMECYQRGFLKGQLVIAQLDEKEIYGWQIWELYKDKCGEDLDKFILEIVPDINHKIDTLNKLGIKEESRVKE